MSLFRGQFIVNNELIYIWKTPDGFWHVSDWLNTKHFKEYSLTFTINKYFNVNTKK